LEFEVHIQWMFSRGGRNTIQDPSPCTRRRTGSPRASQGSCPWQAWRYALVDAERVHHHNQPSPEAKHVLTQPAEQPQVKPPQAKQPQAKQQPANKQSPAKQPQAKQQQAKRPHTKQQPTKQPPDKQPPAKHWPAAATTVHYVLAPETQHATKENKLNRKKLSQEERMRTRKMLLRTMPPRTTLPRIVRL
jgi:hypothetical protein